MSDTKISWAEKVWNPIIGCTKVSVGCKNCYAEKFANRWKGRLPDYSEVITDGHWNGSAIYIPERLFEPQYWKKPKRIFVCSMGDLFHKDVDEVWIKNVFMTINQCPQHQFIILTKRSERAKEWFDKHSGKIKHDNYIIGTSCEDQLTADKRIPILMQIPGKKFVSLEPLLGEINLTSIKHDDCCLNPLSQLDWVVIGAESIGGRPGRECKIEWIENIIKQCKFAEIPVFVKQIHLNGKLLKHIEDFPKHLQIQEYPK